MIRHQIHELILKHFENQHLSSNNYVYYVPM